MSQGHITVCMLVSSCFCWIRQKPHCNSLRLTTTSCCSLCHSVHQLASCMVACLLQFMLRSIKAQAEYDQPQKPSQPATTTGKLPHIAQQQQQLQSSLFMDRKPNTKRTSQKPPATVQQVTCTIGYMLSLKMIGVASGCKP